MGGETPPMPPPAAPSGDHIHGTCDSGASHMPPIVQTCAVEHMSSRGTPAKPRQKWLKMATIGGFRLFLVLRLSPRSPGGKSYVSQITRKERSESETKVISSGPNFLFFTKQNKKSFAKSHFWGYNRPLKIENLWSNGVHLKTSNGSNSASFHFHEHKFRF